MFNARISALASYVPDDILDNDMLSKMVDTNDEWITTRVGIKERRILHKDGAGSSYMGIKAVNKLLAENPQPRPKISTCSSAPPPTPTTAFRRQRPSLHTTPGLQAHTPTTSKPHAPDLSWHCKTPQHIYAPAYTRTYW